MPAVPLGRRNLFHHRRRLLLTVAGIAASFVLVLVLDGVFTGAMRQVTAYIRHSPAELFVAQAGVRTMHMSTSVLPSDAVERAVAVDGVAWVEGLHFATSTLAGPTDSQLSYVFGYDTATGRGGPRRLVAGTAPGQGEIVVDEVAADELAVAVGDTLNTLGTTFTISGLSTGGTYIANTTAFITAADFVALRGPAFAYLLVGTEPTAPVVAVQQQLATTLAPATVMTKEEFAAEETDVVRSMAGDIMAIMTVIGLLIALTLIGLTLFVDTLSRRHEYGVLKALGATGHTLFRTVAAQALWTMALSLVAGVALALVVAAVLRRTTTNLSVDIRPVLVARTAAAAVAIGGLGAVLPLRRIARIDASTAFRRN